MKAEDREADAIERRFGRGQLLEDFDAEARLLNHSPDPADLPLDAIETRDDSLLLCLVQHRCVFFLYTVRRRTLYLSHLRFRVARWT